MRYYNGVGRHLYAADQPLAPPDCRAPARKDPDEPEDEYGDDLELGPNDDE